MVHRLNNIITDDGELLYFTHFKVDYVYQTELTSPDRWNKIEKLRKQIGFLKNDYNKGKPLFDKLLKEYMGVKENKYSYEHETRIVF